MGEKTGIAWTDHTFNAWWGCTKCSPGCLHCYAETFAHRYGFDVWGPGKPRRLFEEKHWNEPRKWDRAAKEAGVRRRVFCGSIMDICDEEAPKSEYEKLWKLIRETPNLDWLLLTKRPHRFKEVCPWGEWDHQKVIDEYPNVWLGTSVVTQKEADENVMALFNIPATIYFLSIEPQIEHIDLYRAMFGEKYAWTGKHPEIPGVNTLGFVDGFGRGIDWVICGGESGTKCRPFEVEWARSLRDQCIAGGVDFFMKQLGGFPDKRDQIDDFPLDLRVRDVPNPF